MNWKWEENSVLYRISKYTNPKDIFEAVCREIGRYFQHSAACRVTKRKVRWIGTNVICQFAFWSSHSNISGKYVCFEIVTSVYAKDKSNMERNGLLRIGIKPKSFDVHAIDSSHFLEIITWMEQTIAYVKTVETPEGFTEWLAESASDDPNHMVFLDKICAGDDS